MTTKISEEMSLLFSMMKQELEKQTTIITEAVTANIMRSIDEKIKPLVEENKMLHLEVEILNSRINRLEDTNRKNNIIIHGVEETETNFAGLFGIVGEIFGKICVRVENYDINKIYRLGKQSTGKIRPIMISLTSKKLKF
ncbi:Endonuclease-reverse transcriptase [Operophtera brumata]|uniref:Endonuclease-reverse transcriptase n=1 Tax=Operophtera brumata TaxID=104452 RepID=A0A0L7KXG4_OPEBR|nr:Endonuclease-reverse transcriptase [Operophtera brumata]